MFSTVSSEPRKLDHAAPPCLRLSCRNCKKTIGNVKRVDSRLHEDAGIGAWKGEYSRDKFDELEFEHFHRFRGNDLHVVFPSLSVRTKKFSCCVGKRVLIWCPPCGRQVQTSSPTAAVGDVGDAFREMSGRDA